MFVTPCFPSTTVILSYSQGQLPTADASVFRVENFHFEDVFCLPPSVHLDK